MKADIRAVIPGDPDSPWIDFSGQWIWTPERWVKDKKRAEERLRLAEKFYDQEEQMISAIRAT